MTVVAWRAWKREAVKNPKWVCPSCRATTPFPHKCTTCRYVTSEHPTEAQTFVRRNRKLYPVFEFETVFDTEK